MRIITGFLRGRKLVSPRDENIRPTTDKVKEAIFNILAGEYIDEVVIDLFAGTGNLGIEAISRGAEHVYFGEISRDSFKLLKENITKCKIQDKVTLLNGDFRSVLKRIDKKAQVILLDPPYDKGMLTEAIDIISELDILKSEGLIIAEHSKREELPELIGKYTKIKEKKYGKIIVSIYSYI